MSALVVITADTVDAEVKIHYRKKKKNPSVALDCSEAALEHKGSAGWMCQMSTVGAQELIFLPAAAAAVEIVSWSIAAM